MGRGLADRIDDCISRFQSLAGRHRYYTGSSRTYCDFALRGIKRVTENHSQVSMQLVYTIFSLKLFRSVCLSIFLNLFHFSSQSNSIPIYVYGCIVYILYIYIHYRCAKGRGVVSCRNTPRQRAFIV